MLTRLRIWARSLLRRKDFESEMTEEMRFHLEEYTADLERTGIPRDEARRRAAIEFGSVESAKDDIREERGLAFTDDIARDLRHALRSLLRARALSATAIVILALGIGMAAATYAVYDTVLVQPLPVTDADRLVLPRTLDRNGTDVPMSDKELASATRATRTLSAVAGEAHQGAFTSTSMDGEEPVVMRVGWVTGNFFEVLGARPALGRLFNTADEACMCLPTIGEATAVVLSYDTWQRRFGADSAILGRTFTNPYTRKTHTIIGVAEPGLAYPIGVEYWMPQVYASGMNVIGRVAPGSSLADVRNEFLPMMDRIYKEQPYPRPIATATVRTLSDAVVGPVRPVIQLVGAAVILLLLIACINVGNLLLLRVTGRSQEIAIRRSLGAGNAAIARQLILETTLLVAAGGALGTALAWSILRAVGSLAIAEVPRMDVVRIAGMPFAVALAGTLVAMVLTGLVPVIAAMRHDPSAPLRAGSRAVSLDRPHVRLRQWLVGSQVALAVVMLAAAGLLVRSLDKLVRVDLGYRAERLSFVRVAVPVTRDNGDAQWAALLHALPPAIRAIPGVTAVTPGIIPPFYGPGVFTAFWEAEGHTPGPDNPMIPVEAGGPEYFKTMDIPILRGRPFLASDDEKAPNVAVLSERAAKTLWGDEDPLGKRIRAAGDTSTNGCCTVVGIAGDIRFRVLRETTPTIYLSSPQYFFQGLIILRSALPLAQIMPQIREAMRQASPEASIVDVLTMDDLLATQRAVPRLSSTLISTLGATALLLSAIGLFGILSALVRERTREIAVRAALGATPARLRGDVLRESLRVTVPGAAVGLAGALAASRLVASVLYEVSPADPLALGGACVLLLLVAVLATVLPAERVTRIDPATALRS